MTRRLSGFLSLALAGAAILPAQAEDTQRSAVLVHGAFVDGSGWKAVYDRLTRDGYEVLIVQNPTVTLADDVAATNRAIAKAAHPVILVGHSYGGAVITQAGDNPKVRSLVYLAAFAPDVGESVAKLAEKKIPGEASAPLLPPSDGFLVVDPVRFPAAFAADVDPSTTSFMAAAQVPWGLGAVGGVITTAAWKTKPSSFMVTTEDRMVPPTAQRAMAERAHARTRDIKSSHAVMLSHPDEVAAFIESAEGSPR